MRQSTGGVGGPLLHRPGRSLVCARERCPGHFFGQDHLQRLRRHPRGDRLGRAADRRGHPAGADRPAGIAQADRERELRVAGGAAGHGQLVERQVRRGHDRPPLLRRLRERRHDRVASRPSTRASCSAPPTPTSSRTPASTPTWSRSGRSSPTASRRPRSQARRQERQRPHRADWEALRARARQPAAAGHGARRRRPPDARLPAQHLRQDVPPAAYGIDPETGLLDYDAVRANAREFKPLILVAGYSAYPRRVNFAMMREIADEVGATLMVDMAHFAGLVAGKVFTGDYDPVPHAHIVTTTTHKTLRGPRGGLVLAQPRSTRRPVDRGCPLVLGGPLRHVMAAKAVALAEARQPEFATYAQADRRQRASAGRGVPASAASSWSPAAPTTTSCCSTCPASASPAARPSSPCSTPASSPTATPSRTTPTAPGTPAASGSAPRRSPPAASVPTSSTRSPS